MTRVAQALAYLGGAIIVSIMLMASGSVVSRAVFGMAFLGDVELTQYGMAIAVACFLPVCQLRGGHIIVDFFTAKASAATRARLDRLGSLAMAVLFALLAWRTGVGAVAQYQAGVTTMQMQWPEWIAYGAMALPLAVAACIALRLGFTGTVATN